MRRRVYQGFVADSRRWERFRFRPGDVVISTPAKAGTTWMQRLVSLLVFGGPELPAPLTRVSPWLDMNTRPLDDVLADLEAQGHRRFVKTHTPLDGVPIDDRATYLCVGRDPRDIAISLAHHMHNMSMDRLITLRANAVGLDDVDLGTEAPDTSLDDLAGKLRTWMDDPTTAGDGMESLASILHHVTTFFDHRHLPNVALFHYGELKADLPGQLLRLAAVLGIELDEDGAARLAPEGSLERMRQRASELAPNADQSLWRSDAAFFRSGQGGEWSELMTAEDRVHYAERVAELVRPEVAEWIHGGPLGL